MVAFANSQGGVILLGVTDRGVVTGIPADCGLEEWVMNLARDRIIIPALEPQFKRHTFDKKIVG